MHDGPSFCLYLRELRHGWFVRPGSWNSVFFLSVAVVVLRLRLAWIHAWWGADRYILFDKGPSMLWLRFLGLCGVASFNSMGGPAKSKVFLFFFFFWCPALRRNRAQVTRRLGKCLANSNERSVRTEAKQSAHAHLTATALQSDKAINEGVTGCEVMPIEPADLSQGVSFKVFPHCIQTRKFITLQ